jgi:cytochrome c peroxidase
MVLIGTALALLTTAVAAQRGNTPITSLKGVAIPERPDLERYVADPQMLVVLGKALFWDVQVGSDGRTACATCHFHAGADHRITNQVAAPATSAAPIRPNTTLALGDFPFHAFANPNDNGSAITRDRRDVVGSAGVVSRTFVDVRDADALDAGADSGAADRFTLGGLKVRQVTARNTPSVINAVFYVRNFWDGRANHVFNSATPFGPADARATVLAVTGSGLVPESVRLAGSSLASQAVGPPLNGVSSCRPRTACSRPSPIWRVMACART